MAIPDTHLAPPCHLREVFTPTTFFIVDDLSAMADDDRNASPAMASSQSRSRALAYAAARALDALRHAARDEGLADVAGDEVGRSLAAFVDRALARDLLAEDLHVMVRYGIDEASSR
ncbi:hypothetical protein ABTW72_03165 [Micromonospora sp. NPDC127501]|uniref:hypothetical protein n=1 Tax=Micromonospora sp. NPDC127501 TaxID=3154872 RepID=UPI003316CA7F